jgi:hypothetical protein
MACDGFLDQDYKDAIVDSNFDKLMGDDSGVDKIMTREIAGQFALGELRGHVVRAIGKEGADAYKKYQACYMKGVDTCLQTNVCRAMPEGTCANDDACIKLPGFDASAKDCSLIKECTVMDEELLSPCNKAFDKATKGLTTTKEAKDALASAESKVIFEEQKIQPTCSTCVAKNNDSGSAGVAGSCLSKKYNTYVDSVDSGPDWALIVGLTVLVMAIVIAGGGIVYYVKKQKNNGTNNVSSGTEGSVGLYGNNI